MSLMRIELNDIRFFCFHGIYETEKKLGNTFIVQLHVDFTPTKPVIKSLSNTVDYVSLYELIKKRMSIPTPLLETIISELAVQILSEFEMVQEVFVKITKEHMPIKGIEGNMSVSILQKRG